MEVVEALHVIVTHRWRGGSVVVERRRGLKTGMQVGGRARGVSEDGKGELASLQTVTERVGMSRSNPGGSRNLDGAMQGED
jgi:hypothetical protein